ncbi:MAG: RNA methyltransferase [Crocinitomicaceae bacterium]|nr:RNA methyltransferase [Crocinitomicaceae bacterium]
MKKNRDLENLFVVEGEKMVRELMVDWPDLIQCICTVEPTVDWQGEVYHTDERTLKEISQLNTPNKLLAVVKKPSLIAEKEEFILALDGVQDPGNMGTILRTADWFNVDKIVCSMTTVDIFNTKVIQSSMGSLFRIPVEYVDLNEYLSSTKLPVYGALLEGDNVYHQTLSANGIVVMGNEGNGISDEIKPLIQYPICIPRFGGAESLNVSVATGILLNEFKRT